MRAYDFGDDFADSNQRDRTLRALEGRADDDMLQLTPPDSAEHDMTDGDDTGDVFLKIARQESIRSTIENKVAEEQGVVVSPRSFVIVVLRQHKSSAVQVMPAG
jgi:hypothetical protein